MREYTLSILPKEAFTTMIEAARILERASQTRRILPDEVLVDGFAEGKISVVMPAYNEASCIASSVSDMKKQFETACHDVEIIVVDDGSVDGTRTGAL